jgi:acyl-CoA thioesterase FadM
MLLDHAPFTPVRQTYGPLPTPKVPRAAPLTFECKVDIFLKDSNAYGNTYFSRYFEWQGVCRERWFFECVAPDMLRTLGVLITKRAHQEYAHETMPFQSIVCRLNSFDVRQCSFYLLFSFEAATQVVATGYQQIVFATHDKHIQRLPANVLEKISRFELAGDPLQP